MSDTTRARTASALASIAACGLVVVAVMLFGRMGAVSYTCAGTPLAHYLDPAPENPELHAEFFDDATVCNAEARVRAPAAIPVLVASIAAGVAAMRIRRARVVQHEPDLRRLRERVPGASPECHRWVPHVSAVVAVAVMGFYFWDLRPGLGAHVLLFTAVSVSVYGTAYACLSLLDRLWRRISAFSGPADSYR